MTLKVLNTETWMELDLNTKWRCGKTTLGSERYPEISPVFNRDGIYLNGKECWVEIAGRTFKYDAKQFKFDLDLLNAGEYDERARKALTEICKVKLATKAQMRLLYLINLSHECRQTRLRTQLHFTRFMENERETD